MSDKSPDACIRRIENAVGIIALRQRGQYGYLPEVDTTTLVKSVLLDAATLLDHFQSVPS